MMILIYIIVGFIAEMIDGTLGMAYGVSCRTFIKTFTGVPSEAISPIIHYAEIPTTLLSMISHIRYKNIDKKIFKNLLVTGIIGGFLGSYIISLKINLIEFIINIYLIIMGIIILCTLIKKNKICLMKSKVYIKILGFVASFLDAIGGGGWGPITTGSLLNTDIPTKKVIGTVNATEFFVTLSSSISFILFISNIKKYLIVTIGLIIGGSIAAPLSAKLCQKISNEKLSLLIGILLIILNFYNFVLFFK